MYAGSEQGSAQLRFPPVTAAWVQRCRRYADDGSGDVPAEPRHAAVEEHTIHTVGCAGATPALDKATSGTQSGEFDLHDNIRSA